MGELIDDLLTFSRIGRANLKRIVHRHGVRAWALATSVTVEGQDVEVAANIGVTLYPWDGTEVADLIKHAGSAVRQAKDRGRNTFQFFTEDMHKVARERLFLENELRRALRRSELTVYGCPLRTGT